MLEQKAIMALRALSALGGAASSGEIGSRMGVTPAVAGALISVGAKKGWVRISTDQDHRTRWTMTPLGHATLSDPVVARYT